MLQEIIFWGLAFVVLTIAEIMTVQFISIWLALSALVTMFLAVLEIAFWQQLLIFVIISALLLLATRPLARKLNRASKISTNYELDVGKTATVIEEIDTKKTTGRVRLNGVDWSALTSDNCIIPEGSTVQVEKVDGAKLVVRI